MGLLELIPSIVGLFTQVFHNASQAEHDQFQQGLQILLTQAQLQQAQIKVNEVEAASTNWFIAGPRPAIMWGLGSILVIYYLLVTITNFAVAWHLKTLVFPMPPLDPMIRDIVLGLLGLGWVSRTYEKQQGVQKNH